MIFVAYSLREQFKNNLNVPLIRNDLNMFSSYEAIQREGGIHGHRYTPDVGTGIELSPSRWQ